MKSIAVTKPDMAVLSQDRLGLSSFGMLSALFGQEILQRSQRRMGFWRPEPLELLEDEPEQQAAGQGGVNINVDMTLLLKSLREEQKGLREQEKKEKAQAMERLVERVVLRERTEHVQERTQQINIQASAIGRSHTIRVTRQAAPRGGMEPVGSVTAVPAAGGWQPQWRTEHPGFPPKAKAVPAGSGSSILLPDALRRRREQALEAAAFSAAAGRAEELLRRDRPVLRDQLRREVSRSVEEALTQQKRTARRREPRSGSGEVREWPEADRKSVV